MIKIKNIREIKANEEETWLIVRSLKNEIKNTKHVTPLSPSTNLFYKYLNLKKQNKWNKTAFDNIYVPQFINELKTNSEKGFMTLNELYKRDKKGDIITLACFCNIENLCHRSIIAGLLQGTGCNVDCNNDYSKYFEMYKSSI